MNIIFNKINIILPGILFASFISIVSILLSNYILIGSITIAIFFGILINNIFGVNKYLNPGVSFSEKHFLSLAIIFMGVNLDLKILNIINYHTILNIVFIIFISIIIALIIGKLFKIPSSFSLLIGIGNGVCGSSAIAASSSIINADDEEIALSISIINILGAVSIFAIPTLLNFLSINNANDQGIIIGSTIQAVGQVAAAGHIISEQVGETATIIKMIRILFLGPLLLILSMFYGYKNSRSNSIPYFNVPNFIFGFIFFAIVQNFNLLSPNITLLIKNISQYLLIIAMASIGLKVSFSLMLKFGSKVILVALLSFVLQIILVIQFVT